MAKFAVIKTGGKQYKVTKGDTIEVEKLPKKEKSKVTFSDVLMVGDEKATKVGTPKVSGAKVEGEVRAQKKGRKVTILKYKSKTRYRKKTGHRQRKTLVEITKV